MASLLNLLADLCGPSFFFAATFLVVIVVVFLRTVFFLVTFFLVTIASPGSAALSAGSAAPLSGAGDSVGGVSDSDGAGGAGVALTDSTGSAGPSTAAGEAGSTASEPTLASLERSNRSRLVNRGLGLGLGRFLGRRHVVRHRRLDLLRPHRQLRGQSTFDDRVRGTTHVYFNGTNRVIIAGDNVVGRRRGCCWCRPHRPPVSTASSPRRPQSSRDPHRR